MVKVHYNLETKKVEGFYPDFINYDEIPEPYIEVENSKHEELIKMLNCGKELYLTENNEFALREIEIIYTEEQRELERISKYHWVDDQISKCERMKLLDNSDIESLNAKITELRQYANNVWATQQQQGYPQNVIYPAIPL